ncbi:MAG: F0F1 ATP synthase subunit epsilon [Burkholderiaceae bacterium]|nr:F0F1 ATP synthase subunit epsilon [Burkholderiaceae bacterium]
MDKTLKVDVVNAEETLFSGNAEFVALPGVVGELGILPGHTPLITLIRPGLVRIRLEGQQNEESIFVAGGVLEVQPEHVIVLADVAVRTKDLDEAKAREAMAKASEAAKTATSKIELAKLEAELSMLAEQLRIIQKIKK